MFRPVTKWNARVERIPAIRDRPQGLPGCDAREARADPHRAAGERGRHEAGRGRPAAAAGTRPGLLPGATRGGDRPRRLLNDAERPIVLAGNGVLAGTPPSSSATSPRASIPVAAFMGKGAIDDRHAQLMAVGLRARDHVLTGFDRADRHLGRVRPGRVRAVTLEPRRQQASHPHRHPAGGGRRGLPAGGRAHRRHRRRSGGPDRRGAGGVGGKNATERHASRETMVHADLRNSLLADLEACVNDQSYPIKPQRALYELRRALRPQDIVVSDVGAHKIWVARLYRGLRAEHGDHLERLRRDGHLAPRRDRREARPPRQGRRALCGDGLLELRSSRPRSGSAPPSSW